MIRVVLDSNILVSGIPASSGTLAEVIQHWRIGSFQLVLPAHIVAEVDRAWQKPYWVRTFPQRAAKSALELLLAEADITTISSPVQGVATHPEDDRVLATAISGNANYLVTGDQQLLALGHYEDVVIVDPRSFLTMLTD